MKISDFKLERYFARHEFSAKYLLSSSDCDGVSMEYVLSCADERELALWNNLKLGYTESSGSLVLRERIVEQYSNIGVDDVVVASPGELNFIAMNLLVGPGDHAIVISPSYQSLYEVIRSVGCQISFWTPEKLSPHCTGDDHDVSLEKASCASAAGLVRVAASESDSEHATVPQSACESDSEHATVPQSACESDSEPATVPQSACESDSEPVAAYAAGLSAHRSEVSNYVAHDQAWHFSLDELERMIRPNTKLIVINFPHNPTGSCITPDELYAIVDMARRHDIWLFSDEMYRGLLIEEGMEELPAVCDIYEKGISLWGMAKSFALAGLRIGWMATGQRDFLRRVMSFKDYLSMCNSAASEILATIALHHKEHFIEPNIVKIRSNLALFADYVSGSNIFQPFVPPRAGSVAFVPIQYDGTSLQFSDMLVEKSGIMTVPAEMFDCVGKYLRIGFGRENLQEVLAVLAEFEQQVC
ncbi:MAG: aminotransferase class I/II-fold pyridoxal phosphate-dependent enzyme [Bacteroidales bacterium]|nr:aminotransferase class I/II-fold pyridoxal phosphate-dependent enzyme [Bacteroidales bacterium]